jgi:BirA family biotin operon repressor/biotin-[acetyl-CoA-carboxylase] ligase
MFHIFQSIPSTNDYCLDFAKQHPNHRIVCMADRQTQGRGRNGKSWQSDHPENLYLSYLRPLKLPLKESAPLSLITGLVIAQLLYSIGLREVQLKWPNDVWVNGAKIAGVLIEGPVIGIGINLELPPGEFDQPVTALSEHLRVPLSKANLAKRLIDLLEEAILRFEARGFGPFQEEWQSFDMLTGKTIRWENGQHSGESLVLGVSAEGGLLLKEPPFVLYSGSVWA